MKIIDILTYPVNLAGNHVFVKVLTDEHLYGIGEAYRVGPDEAVDQVIHYFKEWLIGQDPTRIEHLYRILYNGSRFPGGSMINAAISGIEIALWDLKGKAYGVPVYQLLGGRCRDRIRVYTAAGGGATPKEIEDGLHDVVDRRGFTAIKTSPQPYRFQKMPWGQVLRETRTRMELLRRIVGDDIDIALDPHAQIFEPIRAQELAEVVKPFRPLFYEEPLRPENISAMARLKRKIDIPLATGECLVTKYQFRDLIAANAADILQPDLLLCGGLLEGKKIAAMAEAEYLTVAPHNPLGPISTAVAAHFAVSTPNFLILEYAPDNEGPSRNLILKPFEYADGWLDVPDTPGLGIELNEKTLENHRGVDRKYRRELMFDADGNIAFQ
jgi:galactonate dehydratase